MGLLDTLGGKLKTNMQDPLRMGLLAYGMTGQGQDPGGTAVNAMMQAQQAKAERDKAAAELARKQALQAQMAQAFATNGVTPELLANYSAGGGEGSKELIDVWKFGRTPQSVTPGNMIYNPTTGAMTMPAPKMGEGQMWDGGQVTSAPGYLQAYGDQKAVDARTEIDKYAGQQGISYQYDLGRADYADTKARGMEDYKAGLDPYQAYDPSIGSKVVTSRYDATAGGYLAEKPSQQKIMDDARATRYAETEKAVLDLGGTAAKQLGKLSRLETLAAEGLNVGALTPVYNAVGGIAADLGLKVDGLAEAEQARAVLLQLAQDIPLPPGAASNIDVMQRIQQLPSLTDTPESFAKSVDAMQELAEIGMVAADAVREEGMTPELEAEINEMYATWGKTK